MKTCIQCQKEFDGRRNQKFCSLSCKNEYNNDRYRQSNQLTKPIDDILHRNHRILKELFAAQPQTMVTQTDLSARGFQFGYITGLATKERPQDLFLCYDLAYTIKGRYVWISKNPNYSF
ncbi:MAG: hypothetical protein ACFCUI_05425 [Bernardetiaceae bacterium]